MSTCSPVTLRTTSGPVTKIRPALLMITMSVSAGPYAAPPAAGPSTTEICGTRPDARTMAANTWPTPSSATTPSASRAPPECQRPEHRHPLPDRGVDRVDDVLAALDAHRATHPGGVRGERDRRGAVHLAACVQHAGVVLRGEQAQGAPVEEVAQAQLGIPVVDGGRFGVRRGGGHGVLQGGVRVTRG